MLSRGISSNSDTERESIVISPFSTKELQIPVIFGLNHSDDRIAVTVSGTTITSTANVTRIFRITLKSAII